MHVKTGGPLPSSVCGIKDSSHSVNNTLRGVCGEDGMSLFQDLKLKRRKVDSRCSSDGESVGTSDSTASLSPDAPPTGEASPKDKDRCHTPEDMVGPCHNTKGGGGVSTPFPPQAFIFMMKPERKEESKNYNPIKTNGVIKHNHIMTNGHHNHNHNHMAPPTTTPRSDVIVVKAEPTENGKRSSPSPSPEKRSRSKSPIPNGKSPNGNSDTEVSKMTNGVIKSERSMSLKTEKDEVDGQGQGQGQGSGRASPVTSSSSLSPPPLTASRRSTSPQGQNSNSNSSGGGGSPQSTPPCPSPSTLIITKHKEGHRGGQRSPQNRVPSPQHSQQHQQQHPHPYHHHNPHPQINHLHARLTGQSIGSMPPSPLVHTMDVRSLSNGGGGGDKGSGDPLPVVTSTSLSFHHQSMYRINGVRPEVISGGAVTPSTASNTPLPPPPPTYSHANGHTPRKSPTLSRSPNSSPQSNSSSSGGSNPHPHPHLHSPMGGTIVAGGSLGINSTSSLPNGGSGTGPGHHHHVNLNRTPTVIMGEAGGVRTMLWSQPGQNLPSELGLSPPGGGSPPTNHYGLSSLQQNGHHNGVGGGGSSSASSSPPHLPHPLNHRPSPPHNQQKGGLSMERLWATEALNLSTSSQGGGGGSNSSNGGSRSNSLGSGSGCNGSMTPNNHGGLEHSLSNGVNGHESLGHPLSSAHPNHHHPEEEDYEQPMICMICEDRATGLHYGIITCEGCKGFFKRTVQNRRVYTCVADGTCEITKAQRNRCQYCRFKKCIEQGMVLQAVREDRMPGGRNSGAVYNLYKVPVKYRKHKKGGRGVGNNVKVEKGGRDGGNGMIGNNGLPPPPPPTQTSLTGTILKAALTSPNEVNHLRPTTLPFEQCASMINHLVQCDNFHDIAALQNWEELLEARGDLSDKLCQMGDSIVYRLVQWTKRLPFYQEVPVEVHTRVLTHKWHELLVLTTSAWQAMHTPGPPMQMTVEEETIDNLQVLQRCLQAMMGRSLTLEQLRQDVGQMVERLTHLTRSFRRLGIRIEEYVTLKVIAMLQNTGTKSSEVAVIQERYVKCLRTFLEVTCPSHPNRLSDLLRTLPEVQAAASLLLESKMFYVPFLLNSALIQR